MLGNGDALVMTRSIASAAHARTYPTSRMRRGGDTNLKAWQSL